MDSVYPPGPPGTWLVGSLIDLIRHPLQCVRDLARYGAISSCRFGLDRVYMINKPAYIHELLVTRRTMIRKTPNDQALLALMLGTGLLTNTGESHMRQRRLIQPAFHRKRMQSYSQVMVDQTLTMLEQWQSGQVRNLDHEMMQLALRIIAKSLFSADIAPEAVAVVSQTLDQLQADIFHLSLLPVVLRTWVPLRAKRRIQRATATLNTIILSIIDERRRRNVDTGDLLSMLLLAEDEHDGSGMTNQQVRDEVVTLLLAGHETTANALTWTCYALSQYPQHAARLRAELDSVLGDRAPTMADLPQLPFCAMVIKETLRLYPPLWVLSGRQMDEAVTIGGFVLPKGAPFMVAPYTLHRDPAYWPDPELFDPDRFSPQREPFIMQYSYLPFGAGPRMCIGNSFALLEAQLVLATIAQRFEWTLDPDQQVEVDPKLTLGTKYGMHMLLTARSAPHSHIAEGGLCV